MNDFSMAGNTGNMKETAHENRVDSPEMVAIAEITQETPNVRTFTFEYELHSQPGQFVMLWIPGINQKPFSINSDTGDKFQLTIFAIGETTKALFEMKEGDKVGITGPYGSNYVYEKDTHLITVAGGYGAAPLGYLGEKALADGNTVDFLVGARDADNVLFENRMTKACANVQLSTDDGSIGHKGYVTDMLTEILEQRKAAGELDNVKVYACGPELMQKKVSEIAKEFGVPSEISIERYMKCGFGICGNCCVDDTGQPTCQQGPVIAGEAALELEEFGVYHRDKTGVKENF